MAKKIYVGNLPYSADDASLQTKFSEFGNVESARVVIDRDSGRSKGFGFVEMTVDGEADTAINELNGKDFMGRALNVSEARPAAPREGGRPGGGFRRNNFGGGGSGGGSGGGPRRGGFSGGRE